ncbi:MAG: trypsin-like peptidase domain-containing protein [Planctomycetota bacterium]|nr:trypsin-like peptidase domain-containing protein [Planctomycetota bacterium]
MRRRRALILVAELVISGLLVATGTLVAAETPDMAAVRDAAEARVCLVTAENALGVPLAYASGFLLGEGRFVVTDLASLARPDVKQARLQFRDGSKATATQFAMADPSTGLVAIKVDGVPAGLSGLAFSAASEAEVPGEVVVVGHTWGQDPDKPDIIIGKFSHATSSADLAARLKSDPPKQAVSFLNFSTINPDEASGAPVLDRSGNVVGVLLRIAGADKPLAVPAAALREALVASDRQLKPLAELPKPLWPVAVLPVPGKPVAAADFAQAVRAIKRRSVCSNCNGKGTVTVRKLIESRVTGGMRHNTYKDESKTCPSCRGEGVLFPDGLYAQFARMAEAGTWLASAGGVDPKVRDMVFSNGLDVLRAIAKVGRAYRDDLVQEIKTDLGKAGAIDPRGVVAYVEVRDSVEGPDGKYLILAPLHAHPMLAAKGDRLAAVAEVRGGRLDEGKWIIVAGLVMGRVTIGSHQPLFVQPFAWADGPTLGPSPYKGDGQTTPTPPTTTPSTPTPPKVPGSPSFFGL